MTIQNDNLLDELISEIRSDELDDATSDRIASSAWTKISAELGPGAVADTVIDNETPIHGCDDFQSLIPMYLAGRLSEARSTLVGDHTRECLNCRRVLMAHRDGPVVHKAAPQRRQVPAWLRYAAAAAVLIAASGTAFWSIGHLSSSAGLGAEIAALDGNLYIVHGDDLLPLGYGDRIGGGDVVRTGQSSSATLTLNDGSTVEMAPRSQLSLRAAPGGTTVDLGRGDVIVHAAKQKQGHLYVATDDCTVAVKGTVFSVNAGAKGSRISVFEGAVEVSHAGNKDLLAPGDQISTDVRASRVPLADEIAWAQNPDEYIALLSELGKLKYEITDALLTSSKRTSSELLDLVPADTTLYVAVPNVTDGLDSARQVLAERIAANPQLAAWWTESMADSGNQAELDRLLDQLQTLGSYVEEELVIAGRMAGDAPGAVAIARLSDGQAFRALIVAELEGIQADCDAAVFIVDTPVATQVENALYMWITDELLVITHSAALLAEVGELSENGGSGFASTDFGQNIYSTYAGGVTFLFAIDVDGTMAQQLIDDEHASEMLERFGISEIDDFIVTHDRVDGRSSSHAELSFSGPRRGIVAWLDRPAPMSSLDFISSNAVLVSGALLEDAGLMTEQLINMLADSGEDINEAIDAIRNEAGIDLMRDLAEPLGGEIAVALDGPLLPTPAWKVILEVYDSTRLQATFVTMVEVANRELGEAGNEHQISLQQDGEAWSLSLDEATVAWYTFADGYMVVTPSRALLDRALEIRSSGQSIANAESFTSLLPRDRYVDFSAVAYQNMAPVLGPMAGIVAQQAGQILTDEQQQSLADAIGTNGPSMLILYGELDRIIAAASGSGTGSGLVSSAASGQGQGSPLGVLPHLLTAGGGGPAAFFRSL